MDLERYIKTLIENMPDSTKNKVLDFVAKDGYRVPGWTKLSKIPIGMLAKKFCQSEEAYESLIKHTCNVYFNSTDETILNKRLREEKLNPEIYSGYLAALAYLGEDETDFAENLLENGIWEDPEPNSILMNSTKSEQGQGKEEEKNMSRLLGYIKVVQGDKWDYFNFHPLMYLDENDNLIPIANVQAEFPTRGNIFLYTRKPDSSLIYDNFLNQNHYILNIDENDLEPNYKANGYDRNDTNFKINVENLIYRKKSTPISDAGIFYVATPKDHIESGIGLVHDLHIAEDFYDVGDIVLLKINNRLIGPFKLCEDENDNTLVIRFLREMNYVFTTYICDDDNLDNHIMSLRSSGYYEGDIKKPVAQISKGFKKSDVDYISDELLLEELCDYLSSTKNSNKFSIEDINILKQNLVKSSNLAIRGNRELTDKRLQRISDILESNVLIERNVDDFIKLIKTILERLESERLTDFDIILKKITENKDFLSELMPRYKTLRDEVESLRAEKEELEQKQIEEIYRKNKQLQEEEQQLIARKSELETEVNKIKTELNLVDDIKQLEWTKDYLQRETADLENKKNKQLKAIQETIGNMFNGDDMSLEIAKSIRSDGISQAIIDASANLAKENDQNIYTKHVEKVANTEGLKLSGGELIEDLINKIRIYRNYEYNDIANLLICVAQGFITIFSGEPGTGKTSICNILGHALGLDRVSSENDINISRYISVSVERGWTSKRDFIGYYNPLTKTFDSGNNHVYAALKVLNQEVKSHKVKFPMLILLDEANLSSMEYYWADFMNLCDDKTELDSISIGNNEILSIPKTLRFVGTINNDHTTELLSPRLIDRAWIIVLPNCPEGKVEDLVFNDINEMVVWDNLYDALTFKDSELTGRVKKILEDTYKRFKDINISVSPRADKAIKKYCATAQNLFKDEDSYKDIVAADYAILQKLLTKVNGNGEKFKENLEKLRDYFKEAKLTRCTNMVTRILQKGEAMRYYKFF